MGEIHGRLKRDILIETSPSVSPLIFVGNIIYIIVRDVFLIYQNSYCLLRFDTNWNKSENDLYIYL